MPQPKEFTPVTNRLLMALSDHDRTLVLDQCKPVELAFGQILSEPGERIRYVYFPTTSFISQVAPIDGRASLEVGLVGDEGMFGISLLLGVDISPLHTMVQGAGTALKMSAAPFCHAYKHIPALDKLLKRYVYVVISQLAQNAACTCFHLLEARLARWLLMTRDRAHGDDFQITQEFLAYMLGVRRVGITKAAMALQEQHLIQYHRGNIHITDRVGLEAASCSCYQADQASYAQMLG